MHDIMHEMINEMTTYEMRLYNKQVNYTVTSATVAFVAVVAVAAVVVVSPMVHPAS